METRLSNFQMSETWPKQDITESLSALFLLDQDENLLLMKKKVISLKTTNSGKDETETRVSMIEINKTRQRQDRNETRSENLSETMTRPRVSVLLVSRPRRNQNSRPSLELVNTWVNVMFIEIMSHLKGFRNHSFCTPPPPIKMLFCHMKRNSSVTVKESN